MLPIEYKSHIVDTPELFDKLVRYVENHIKSDLIVMDTETDSVQEKTANLYGISFCYNLFRGFYIPFKDKVGKETWNLTYKSKIAQWLLQQCQMHKVLMHNAVYDVLILENQLDIKIEDYIYCDTMLLKHTCDENKPHGLKDICLKEFGNWTNKPLDLLKASVKVNGGKVLKDDIEMYKADTKILGEYSISDCILTLLVYNKFILQLKAEGLEDFFFNKEAMPLFHVTLNMKRQGFHINIKHFEQLQSELQTVLIILEEELMEEINPQVYTYVRQLLSEEFPIKHTGNFPKALAKAAKIPLPINSKTNKITTSAKALDKISKSYPEYYGFYEWIKGKADIPLFLNKYIQKTRDLLFKERYPDKKYIFNLKSNLDLSHFIFDVLGYQPLEKTPKGARKLDDDLLDSIKSNNLTFNKLITYKKLGKLLSTYVGGILDRQIDGKIYTSLHQTGTVSGRYASSNPNLQNLPRTKEDDENIDPLIVKYTNAIRQGFISPSGYDLIDGDYDQIEARCFSAISGEKNLQQVFFNNDDIYSKVSADIYNIDLVKEKLSLNKKNDAYFGKIYPEKRHTGKTITLAIPYGSETQRVSEILNCSRQEAKNIITTYLSKYPSLHKWMRASEYKAKHDGYIKTRLGRIRHLPQLTMMYTLWGDQIRDYQWAARNNLLKERRIYKVALNTSKNIQCQGYAASIINQTMIAIHNELKKQQLDAHIILTIHDEIIVLSRKEHSDKVAKIIKDKAENTNKLEVPLVMNPKIASNWAEAK